jgi:predicted ABC-type ATPase
MPTASSPKVVVLAGPNGAGKSTSAARLLLGVLKVNEFVNADVIASGLSAFAPELVAFEAGRVMLGRLKELAASRKDFAFETTLASRSYAAWLKKLRDAGYEVHLVFLWLPSADAAVARVAERVRGGGHDVPELTICRRYEAGLRNFLELYIPLADTWQVIDNSSIGETRIVSAGGPHGAAEIFDKSIWESITIRSQQ